MKFFYDTIRFFSKAGREERQLHQKELEATALKNQAEFKKNYIEVSANPFRQSLEMAAGSFLRGLQLPGTDYLPYDLKTNNFRDWNAMNFLNPLVAVTLPFYLLLGVGRCLTRGLSDHFKSSATWAKNALNPAPPVAV